MKTNRSGRYSTTTLGFVDVLFVLLAGFVVVYILAIVFIKKEETEAGIKPKAEYVVVLSWDEKSSDDVDIWLWTPGDRFVSFRDKEVSAFHLARDDLGTGKDTIFVNNKRVVVHVNEEILTFRAVVPGEYVLSAHLYSSKKQGQNNRTFSETSVVVNVPVTVALYRINPTYTLKFRRKVTFTHVRQEITIASFIMDDNGDLHDVDHESQIPFVNDVLQGVRQ